MAKVQRVSNLQRYKNIGKSFGYAAIDAAGQLNPTLARLGRETKMVASDISSSIRDIDRDSITQSIKDFTNPNGDNAINNIINDFKTGQWYNKERMEGGGFDDFDIDFGTEDEDWGDMTVSSDDEESGTSATLINNMQNLSGDLAMSMGRTSAASAEYIAKSSHRDSRAKYDLNKAGFSNITSLMTNMNHKLDVMIEMQAPLVQNAQNAFVFQTKATEFFEGTNETLTKMNASLERIVENTNILNPDYQPKKYNKRDKSLSSLIVGDEFDFGAYFDMISENIKETKDMVKSFTDMGAMFAGQNGKNLSPMAMAMTGAMKAMVPEVVKESMETMNKSFEGFVPMLLKDLRQTANKKGGLFSLLGDLFLPNTSVKNKYSKSNYNKGPVAWDGIARKSVVEVIPTYLAKIYAALGGEEKYYDFTRGQFVSGASIMKDFRGKLAYDAKEAGGDLRTNALRVAGSDKSKAEINEFFMKAAMGEVDLKDIRHRGMNDREWEKTLRDMGLSRQSATALLKSINSMDTKELSRYTIAMLSAQQNTARRYKNEEERGYSNLDYIDNGFTVNKDEFKMSQSEYLHGIYQMVGNIYGVMSGGSGKDVFDMKSGRFMSMVEKQNKERSNMDRKHRRDKNYDPNHPEFTDEEADLYKYYGMSDKDIEDFENKKKWEQKSKDAIAVARKRTGDFALGVKNRARRLVGKRELTAEEDAAASPFARITDRVVDIFDTVSNGLVDLIYGDRGDKGLIETITDKFKDFMKEKITDPFKNFFKENIWEPIKGKAGEFWTGVKKGFRGRTFTKNLQNEDYQEDLIDTVASDAARTTDFLRKQGYSESFSRKQAMSNAKLKQDLLAKRKAKEALKAGTENIELDGGAARGRKVTRTGLVAVSEGELIIPSEFNPFYRGKTNKRKQIRDEQRVIDKFYGAYAEGGVIEDVKEKAQTAKNTVKDKIDYVNENLGGIGEKVGGRLNDAATALGAGVSHFFSAVMGDLSEKGIEDQKKKISEGISKVMADMGVNKKAMGVGAIAGVGVSLLTGAVVGPIAGAAIGAGVGLLSKSEYLQKMLFGEIKTDDKGNIVEDNRTFIGRAKDSIVSGVQNALKKVSSKITPEMIAGGTLGALLGGPFGIVGGALMGGAGGFLATTEKFKVFMFGDGTKSPEEDDSFTGLLRNKVFANLDDIFHNTGIAIKGLFRDLNKKITSAAKSIFEDIRKKAMSTRIGVAVDKLGKLAGGIVKAPVKLVGGALGGINRGLQKHNLRRGLNIWNRAEKRNMTAEERIAAREQLGTDIEGLDRKNMNLDQMINSRTSEELFQLQDKIKMLQDSKWAKKKAVNDTMENMYNKLSSAGVELTPKDRDKIDKLVRGGNYGEAVRTLRKAGISSEEAEKILGDTVAENKNTNQVGKAIEAAKINLKNKGIDLRTDVKGEKALQLIEDEIKAKGYTRETAEEKEAEKDKNDYAGTLFGMMASIVREVSALNGEAVDPIALMKGKYKAIVAFNPAQNAMSGAQRELQQKLDNKKAELMAKYKDDPRYQAKYGNKEEGDTDKNDIITKTDGFGGIHRYRKNPQTGELEEVTNDKETDMSKKKLDKFFDSIYSLPVIGTTLNKVSGLFSSLHDKLFGSKDDPDKKGIFGKLFDFISGKASSAWSMLTNFFTGAPLGKSLATVAKNLTLGTVVKGVFVPALLAGGLFGAFDEWFNTLFGKLGIFKGNDTKDAFSDEEVTVVDPETGEPTTVHAGFDNSLSGNLKRNLLSTTIRGLARGGRGLGGIVGAGLRTAKRTWTNQILKGTAIGGNMAKYGIIRGGFADLAQKVALGRANKATKLAAKGATYLDDAVRAANSGAKNASKLAAKASKTATKAAEMSGKSASAIKTATAFAEKGMIEGISTALANACERLPDILKKIPFLPANLKNNADDLALQLFTHLDDALKGAGKKLATIANKIADIMPLINIAYSVAVGINAWGNAESILGITDTATFGQKCIATLIAVVNSLIPFVGDLIPNNVLVNIFMTILPKIGIDVSDLQTQRDEATKIVSEYNAEHGTDYSIAQYNELVQGKAGIFTKGWHAVQNGWDKFKAQGGIKGAAQKAWAGTKNLAASIKENGLGETAQNMLDKISEYEPKTGIGKAAKGIWDVFGSKLAQMKLLALKGDVKGLITYEPKNSTESTAEKILNIGLNIYKITNLPIAVQSFIAHKVFDGIKAIINKVKSTVETAHTEFSKGWEMIHDPNSSIHDMLDISDVDNDPENPMGGFTKALIYTSRLAAIPVAVMDRFGTKVSEFFVNTGNKIKSSFEQYYNVSKSLSEKISTGSVKELWAVDLDSLSNDEENPLSGFQKAMGVANKVLYTIPTFVVGIGKGIGDFFKGMVEKTKSNHAKFDEVMKKISEAAKQGDLKSVWLQDTKYDHGDPLNRIWSVGTTISQLFNSAVAIFNKLAGPIGELINMVKEKVQPLIDTANVVGNWWEEKVGEKVEGAKGWVSDKVDAAKDYIANKASGVYDSARDYVTGGSSFINQRASAYANKGFAGSTFGEKGCGPAVAAMTANSLGKNMSLGSAVRRSSGYQNSGGVDIGYFSDALGQSGISTSYVSGAGAANQLAAGNKVILLGQDGRNTSKANSPFGPGNHYVLATGIRNGKVIVNDPENNGPRAYSPSILNNVKMGVAAAGSRIRKSRLGRFLSGGGTEENISQIWGFLKDKGLSDVAIAGLMGCWEVESSNSPDTLEGNYALKANSNEIMSNTESMNNYTSRLFELYKKNGISINQSGYMGSDGNYYPGYGLAQWTGPRQYQLTQFADENGLDHRDLATQLEYFWSEYESRPNLQKALDSAESVQDATIAALDHYEMRDGWHTTDRGKKQLAARLAKANDIFSKMEGQEGTLPVTGTHTSSSGTEHGGSNGTWDTTGMSDSELGVGKIGSGGEGKEKKFSVLNFMSEFSSLWSKAFSGKKDEETDTDALKSNLTGISDTFEDGTSKYGDYGDTEATSFKLKDSPSEIMRSILGKIKYSMNGPRDPEQGSADCSSTVQWAIKKAGGPDIGGNTGAMYNNPNLESIWHDNGAYAAEMPEDAEKDDVLFFARPGGSSDKGAALDHVGHVGLYLGDGQYIHHGSGMGPKIANFAGAKTKLIKVARLISPDELDEEEATPYANTSIGAKRVANNARMNIIEGEPTTSKKATTAYAKTSKGSKRVARNSKINTIDSGMGSELFPLSAGDSGIFGTVSNVGSIIGGALTTSRKKKDESSTAGSVSYNTSSKKKGNGIDPALVNQLLESVAGILENTYSIDKIYDLLASALSGGDSKLSTIKSTAGGKTRHLQSIPKSADDIDSNIVQLAGTLAALAKG